MAQGVVMNSSGRKIARSVALAALLALGGCAFVRSLLGGGFERPTLTYESWSADHLDLDGVTIALHYRIDNPNDFGLDLRRLGYRLEVEGRQIVEGDLPGGVQMRAKGATPVAIPVRLRWKDVPGFVELLLTRAEVAYRVSGNAGIGWPMGTIDLPFDHRDRVALPRPPSIGIEGITVRDSSLSNLSLDLKLRVENRNTFPLPVGALTYGLRVGQRDVVAGGAHPLVAVPPGGRATVALPVRISVLGVADSVSELLRGAELRLHGLAEFGPMQVPVDVPGHLR
jgi:LEA14-like dessication related protein